MPDSPTPRAPEGDEPTTLDALIRVLKSACQNNDAAAAFGAERGLRELFARLRSVSEDARTAPDAPPTDETDPRFALRFVLHFCEAAIRDAITLEDGLDAETGRRVLAMIDAALAPAAPAERPTDWREECDSTLGGATPRERKDA